MAKTAAQALQNWKSAMASPSTAQAYKDGINGYNGNPMAAAATPEAMQRYQDGVARSISSGRRANALNNANPQDWKNNAINVGATRLSSGAQKGANKAAAAFNKFAPVWAQMSQTVASMPKGGLANAQARQNAALAVLMQAAGTA